MGGTVPLGYEVRDRKLIVVPDEAQTVRAIMERYIATHSVRTLLAELQRDGIVSKRRTMRDGSVRGGIPFTRGALYWLLSNRVYVGETRHRDKTYPGEHEAIVSRELFDAVQKKLAERTNPCSPGASRKLVSLLAGMIRDHLGRPMSPAHTQNHGRRYRYYVSNSASGANAPALRLPAGELDATARKQLAACLADIERTRELVPVDAAEHMASFVSYCTGFSRNIVAASIPELRHILQSLDFAMTAGPNGIRASFSMAALLRNGGIESPEAPHIELSIPTHQAWFGHEPRLRLDSQPGVPNKADQRLVDALARSFAARERLMAMDEQDVATIPKTELRHLERIARLSYLDPAIVRSILDGTQASHLSARNLWRWDSLPLTWAGQREVLLSHPS